MTKSEIGIPQSEIRNAAYLRILKTTNVARKKIEKKLLGAVEKIDLPEFDLYDMDSRVDTGAATSSLHCHHVKVYQRAEKEYISFKLLDPSHPDYQQKTYRTSEFREKLIKSSFGQTEYRYAIKTDIILFGQKYHVELTLADREKMQFPILIGRNVLRRNFIVDVGKKNLSFKLKA